MSPWPAKTEFPLAGPAFPDGIPAPPAPTPADHLRRAPKRRRTIRSQSRPSPQIPDISPNISLRQSIADQAEVQTAITQCELFSGNDQHSCFPTEDTILSQGEWVSFVWNSKRPELTQQNKVNVYLYRADSMRQVHKAEDLDNDPYQSGVYRVQADDAWWGEKGADFNEGQATTYPFYWVITPASRGLDGSQQTQAIFSAIQTTYPNSVLASMSASSAAASQSSASASSAAASPTSTLPGDEAGDNDGNTNNIGSSSSNDFPQWAIAVIVVLGFLAIAALCLLAFIILRRSRRRRYESNRNSMGSASPMMAQADTLSAHVASPLLPPVVLSPRDESSEDRNRATSVHDAASTISAGDGPFSGADAAIMAEAFRKALRKPDFVDIPVEEGESPPAEDKDEQILSRELAEEGKDLRSVASSRGVRVETPEQQRDH